MHDGRIIGNHVETCGGIGIGVTTDPPGGLIVTDNIVRGTQATGIHIGVPNAIVSGNRVEDWGLRGGRRRRHARNRRRDHLRTIASRMPALTRAPLHQRRRQRSRRLILRDNVSETANPLGVRAG